jgi:hypothetical protein
VGAMMFGSYRKNEIEVLNEKIKNINENEANEMYEINQKYQKLRNEADQELILILNEEKEKLKEFFKRALEENETIYQIDNLVNFFDDSKSIGIFVIGTEHLMNLKMQFDEENIHFEVKITGFDEKPLDEFIKAKITKFKDLIGTLPEYRLPSICTDFFSSEVEKEKLKIDYNPVKQMILSCFQKGIPLDEIPKTVKISKEMVDKQIDEIIKDFHSSFNPFAELFAELDFDSL